MQSFWFQSGLILVRSRPWFVLLRLLGVADSRSVGGA